MSLHPLPASTNGIPSPQRFTNPFGYVPHPLCVAAAGEVKAFVARQPQWEQELSAGKMFGVLVVESAAGRGFLAAFSGTLEGQTQHPYFVPPVYDLMAPGSHFQTEEQEISAITQRLTSLQSAQRVALEDATCREAVRDALCRMQEAKRQRDLLRRTLPPEELARRESDFIRESQFLKAELRRAKQRCRQQQAEAEAAEAPIRAQIESLRRERQLRSQALQEWLFAQFSMRNARGERHALPEIFHPAAPPSGAGECCAPKLLQYAYLHDLRPLCMAEFWVGASPIGEVRTAGNYYPACDSKCRPILNFMLQGLTVDDDLLQAAYTQNAENLRILYEDPTMVVVSKPAGMLSVPGKSSTFRDSTKYGIVSQFGEDTVLADRGKDGRSSVESLLRERYPEVSGPMIVHRLDMDTSGLMVVALTEERYHALQSLFLKRQVAKTYIALLEHPMPVGSEGEICLPLRPDVADRPRQMVDDIHGRRAVTRYRVLGEQEGHALVELRPLTGRTHQLRVHCAHCRGLANPIVGDRLYGTPSRRLMLHAARLTFETYDFHDDSFPGSRLD